MFTESSNPFSKVIVQFSVSITGSPFHQQPSLLLSNDLWISVNNSCIYFAKFIPKYFIIFDFIVNWVFFPSISFLVCYLLLLSVQLPFFILLLPVDLMDSFIITIGFFVDALGFPTNRVMPFLNKNSFFSFIPIWILEFFFNFIFIWLYNGEYKWQEQPFMSCAQY